MEKRAKEDGGVDLLLTFPLMFVNEIKKSTTKNMGHSGSVWYTTDWWEAGHEDKRL